VETSGYSGGFVPGPSPIPGTDETAPVAAVSPLDPSWQPPAMPAAAASPAFDAAAPMPVAPDAMPAPVFAAPAAFAPAPPPVAVAAPVTEAVLVPVAMPAPMPEQMLVAEPVAMPAPAPVAEPVAMPVAMPVEMPVAVAPPLAVPVAAPMPAPPAAPAPAAMPAMPVMPAMPAALAAPAALAPDGAWEDLASTDAAANIGIAESEAFAGAYARASTEESVQNDDIDLHSLLAIVLEKGASDLHLTSGSRPQLRLNGHLTPLEDFPELTPNVIQRVMYAAITQKQRERFEEVLELDFAYSVPGKARFRVNMYRQRDSVGAAFRLIPFEIKKIEDLGLPPGIANFAMLPRGFVLVTGPTGSGKSTTLAAIVDLANRQRRDHIMTVEDPIEFLHRHQSCVVNQREVGEDTHSFGNALKHVLRQDPDIILVGEMRDLETISVALTAAETGHLVFATLHTQDAAQTIDRIIDVFPPHQQQQVRVQLAGSLQGVVCQTLARTTDGKGRVVATEVLVATPAVRNLIREGKTHQIYSAMQAGSQHGMHTLDQHLADLVKRGHITYETGIEKCHHIEDFNRLTGR
jgi:twitching motility protein PilT